MGMHLPNASRDMVNSEGKIFTAENLPDFLLLGSPIFVNLLIAVCLIAAKTIG